MPKHRKIPFEEAERHRGVILTIIGISSFLLIWIVRHNTILLGLVSILTIYLLTGDRYQWVYIWRKTIYRDMVGLRVLIITMFTMWIWRRRGVTVVTRWAKVAQKTPNKKAFIMGNRSLTFREGDEFSNRIARHFKLQGFKIGEVIALFMETQPEYVFIWLGLAKVGVTTALVNTNLRGKLLVQSLQTAGCKAVIFGDEMAEVIKAIQSEISDILLFQYNSPERQSMPIVQHTTPLAAKLDEISSDSFTDIEPLQKRDTLLYIYTSGTTGLPKAAVITNIRYFFIPFATFTAGPITTSDIIYNPLPLYHIAGGVLGAGLCLVLGCTVVLRNKFSARNYWGDAIQYECTIAQYIGEICRFLLKVPPGLSDRAHRVRLMIGSGLRPQIWQDFINRFGIKRILEFYGATESNTPLVNLDSTVGAIGFLNRLISFIRPFNLVKCDEVTGEILRDKQGKCIHCGINEPGLLLGKINAKKDILNFTGYADKAASEEKIVRNVKVKGDSYFNTGDILVMDHYGYFYFKDRTGDTFRWRGENVSTSDVEGVMSSLIGLKDAIVYGVTIPNAEGRAGMAAIADPENKLDLVSLANIFHSSLPTYARPLFIRILPEIPLTATFKYKKRELMKQGFNIHLYSDPIFFFDRTLGSYVPLSQKLYDDLVQGCISY